MRKLIVLLIVSMFCASVSAVVFYEDFETTGDQYTLYGGASSVAGGHLEGIADWGHGAFMDGTYATPTAGSPLTYKATFNFGGMDDYTWATPVIGWSSDGGSGFLGQANGFMVAYIPLYEGGTMDLLYNPTGTGVWTDVYWNPGNEPMPGGFDLNADYELVVVDSGDSLDYWVQLASDPSIKTVTITSDISGYARIGELAHATAMGDDIYIDDFTISGAGEPVGTIDPGSISISEPSGSDTYVITLTEAIPGGAEFRVYLDPCDLWDGGLKQATVAPAKVGDPNTALDIVFTSFWY